jgi:hypothetical protein
VARRIDPCVLAGVQKPSHLVKLSSWEMTHHIDNNILIYGIQSASV